MVLPLPQAITRLLQNEEALDIFTNGSDTQSYVTRNGVQVPTLRRFLKELREQIIGIADQSADNMFADLFVLLGQKASIGSKTVSDRDYVATPSDVQIVYTALTQRRVFELPDILLYPYGQELVVADGSNSADEVKYIEIKPKSGSNQVVNDGSAIGITNRGQAMKLRRASDTMWFTL